MIATSYVLITPVRNEEAYIRRTLESVIAQTLLPKIWIIVNDGSVDRTEAIVREYTSQYPFIQLVQRDCRERRTYGSRVRAIQTGFEQLDHANYDYCGILDGDLSIQPDYYESLLKQFQGRPQLGIAGGVIFEEHRGRFQARFATSEDWVAGGIQLFRRACYEDVGGYRPLMHGGSDALAVNLARMHGWEVCSFPKLVVQHYRATGSAGLGFARARFRDGAGDYCLGYHPLFELVKCLRRTAERPYLIGTVFRALGYCWFLVRREAPDAPLDVVRYLRQAQMKRILTSFRIHHERSTSS